MRVFRRPVDSHLFCGHWNGSELEIGLGHEPLYAIPYRECLHRHPYAEYYLGLVGRARLQVGAEEVELAAGTLVMVEAEEPHRISWIDPEAGAQWVIIKARSIPDSKIPVDPATLTPGG